MQESSSGRNIVEVLAEEFVRRYRQGDRPPLSEYTQKFPQHAAEIQDLFPAMLLMENLKPVTEDEAAASASLLKGAAIEHLGDYRIIREVGRGGMGIVYEAEQVSLGRHVALKVLPKELLKNPKQRLRFEREARAAAKLHHTNIVPVFGVGEDDGMSYYVMQFIQGLTLDEVLNELKRMNLKPGSSHNTMRGEELRIDRRAVSAADVAHSLIAGAFPETPVIELATPPEPMGQDATLISPPEAHASHTPTPTGSRLSDSFMLSSSSLVAGGSNRGRGEKRSSKPTYWHSVARIGVQVGEAMAYAHGQGIHHRDLKPANLLLDMRGTVWVTDFGLAKLQDDQGLTQTGDILGTLRYMAPESFKGVFDDRSEIYSLGLTLYELLALRPAFEQTNRNMLVDQVMNAGIERLDKRNPEIPADLQMIIHKAIERDPQHRYQAVQHLADDLQRFIDDEPVHARRVTLIERAARWSRHNKGLARALAMVAVLLLIINTAGPIYTWRMAQLNKALNASKVDLSNSVDKLTQTTKDLSIERNRAETAKTNAEKSAQQAEAERRRAQTTLADMQTERGLLAGEQGDAATAMLWFATAAQQTPHDPSRQAENRRRARNWMDRAPLPVASYRFPNGGGHRRIVFQPNGDLLLAAKVGSVQIWDWRRDHTLPWTDALVNITDACWSPNGREIALAFETGEVEIRAVPSGNVTRHLKHPGPVQTVEYSPDGTLVAIASHVVQVWNLTENGKPLHEWRHPSPVYAVAFSRAGTRLATACDDNRARVFAVTRDSNLPAPLFAPVPHEVELAKLAPIFVNEDEWLITIDQPANKLGWWDAETGVDASPVGRDLSTYSPRELVAAPDGQSFAVAVFNSCDVYSLEGKKAVLKHLNHLRTVEYSADQSLLVTGCDDWKTRLWNLRDPTAEPLTIPHLEDIQHCTVASGGRHVAVCGQEDLRVWKLPEEQSVVGHGANWSFRHYQPRIGFNGRWVTPGKWHESALEGVNSLNSLTVIDLHTGKPVSPAIELTGIIDSCLCADNKSVAIATASEESGQVVVCDVSSGRKLSALENVPGVPLSVAARPGHPQVAVLGSTGQVVVFDQSSGKQLQVHQEESNPAAHFHMRVRYSPDGRALVAVTGDKRVIVRDAETGKLRFPPIRPVLQGGPCRCIAISNDSRWLATAVNGRNAVQVWDLSTGKAASQALPHPGDFHGIFTVAFSPDGRWVVSANKDGRARVWDWKAGKLVCPPLQHSDEVFAAEFTADGRHVLTAVRHGTARLWEVMTGKLIAPPFEYSLPQYHSTDSLAISGDRAIVSGPGYPLLDLATLLEEPDLSTDELKAIGELAGGGELLLGERSIFSVEEWRQRWAKRVQQPFSLDKLVTKLTANIDEYLDADARLLIARKAADQRVLDQLVTKRPDVPQLQMVRTQILREQGDEAGAKQCYDKVLALSRPQLEDRPDDDAFRTQVARFLVEQDRGVWQILKPLEVTSDTDQKFQLLPDDSILAGSSSQNEATYTIVGRCEGFRINALRLEVLPDASLPSNGPGWAPGGNFHLTEFRASVVTTPGQTQPIKFRRVASDYARPIDEHSTEGNGPQGTIDGDHTTRWDVWPHLGQPHWLVLLLEKPIEIEPEAALRVQLDFRDPAWHGHLLGRFRLACSNSSLPVDRTELRSAVTGNGLTGRHALAAAYLVIGEPEQAHEILESTPPASRDTPAHCLLQAELQLSLGQKAAAQATCDRFLELLKTQSLHRTLEPVAIGLLHSERRWDARRTRKQLLASVRDAELDRLTREIQENPSSIEPYYRRGVYHARHGRWSEAARDYRDAGKVQPSSRFARMWAAPSLILAGEEQLYREHCRTLLEQLGDSEDPAVADTVCKICLLRPNVAEISQLPIKQVREGIEKAGNTGYRPWFVACSTLCSYREGNYQPAIDSSMELSDPTQQPGALAMTVRAMAQHQLGQTAAARQTLAQVEAALMPELHTLGTDDYSGPLPVSAEIVGHDWLIPEILRREAVTLFAGTIEPKP